MFCSSSLIRIIIYRLKSSDELRVGLKFDFLYDFITVGFKLAQYFSGKV